MWVFLNDSFVSFVAHLDQPGHLRVRARAEGDIERFLGSSVIEQCPVFTVERADYHYRCVVPKEDVGRALADHADSIDYPNFKDSIPKSDVTRKSAYMDVWSAMLTRYGGYGTPPRQ